MIDFGIYAHHRGGGNAVGAGHTNGKHHTRSARSVDSKVGIGYGWGEAHGCGTTSGVLSVRYSSGCGYGAGYSNGYGLTDGSWQRRR